MLLPLIAAIIALSACAARTSVGRIMSNPYRYQNREVNLNGRVTGRVNAIIAGGYRLDDGTGVITVISNGTPPRVGDTVSVTGRVAPAASILGNPVGLTLRERDRRVNGERYRRP